MQLIAEDVLSTRDKMSEEKEKYCPLMSNQFEYETIVCMKEKCAWWNYKDSQCSITQLGWFHPKSLV